MRCLFLGGTNFLGRQLVEEALRRGDRVTLFTRGITNPDLFPDVERLRGDRAQDLGALDGRTWDAVVDTCGFVPSVVEASAQKLAGAAGQYTFVSSISVYPDFSRPGLDESWPASPPDFDSPAVSNATYGPMKRGCEIAVERAFGDHALIVRPGFIVGPYDPIPRLPCWLRRVARGGETLAPGDPARPVQLVDGRDIATWLLDLAARRAGGLINVTAPPGLLTMGAMLEVCRAVTGSDARFVWADEARLAAAGVAGDALPYAIPPDAAGVMQLSVERAVAAGFTTRPFADTARDTWAWLSTLPPETPPHTRVRGAVTITTGLAPDDEARAIAALTAESATRGD